MIISLQGARMRSGKTWVAAALGIILMTAVSWTAPAGGREKTDGRTVPHAKIRMSEYQNFLQNWDEKKDPLLYALISTPAEYQAIFHPAPAMPSGRPFAPDESLYEKEQILVVARVMPYPENVDDVFEIAKIVERGGDLSLEYTFNKPATGAAWQAKIYLAARIPKRPYRKIFFFENGKPVGALNAAAGQWSVPAAPRMDVSRPQPAFREAAASRKKPLRCAGLPERK